jgi:hypothetical protein
MSSLRAKAGSLSGVSLSQENVTAGPANEESIR